MDWLWPKPFQPLVPVDKEELDPLDEVTVVSQPSLGHPTVLAEHQETVLGRTCSSNHTYSAMTDTSSPEVGSPRTIE